MTRKFNLTEERKKLLNDFEWTRQRYDKLDLVRKIFALVEKQDAEFIRLLKEDFKRIKCFNANGFNIDKAIQDRIDYRAGKSFSNHSPQEHLSVDKVSADKISPLQTPEKLTDIAPEDTQNNPQQEGCGEEVLIQPNKDGAYYPFECGKRYKQGLFICDKCKKKSEDKQPFMRQGEYTTGALCKCRHTYKFHEFGGCAKCDCEGFEYLKDWKKKSEGGKND